MNPHRSRHAPDNEQLLLWADSFRMLSGTAAGWTPPRAPIHRHQPAAAEPRGNWWSRWRQRRRDNTTDPTCEGPQ